MSIAHGTFGSFYFNTEAQFLIKKNAGLLETGSLYFVEESIYLAESDSTVRQYDNIRILPTLPNADSDVILPGLLYCGANTGGTPSLGISNGVSWRFLNESTKLSVVGDEMTFTTTTFDTNGKPVTVPFTYTPPAFEVDSGKDNELLAADQDGVIERSGYSVTDEITPEGSYIGRIEKAFGEDDDESFLLWIDGTPVGPTSVSEYSDWDTALPLTSGDWEISLDGYDLIVEYAGVGAPTEPVTYQIGSDSSKSLALKKDGPSDERIPTEKAVDSFVKDVATTTKSEIQTIIDQLDGDIADDLAKKVDKLLSSDGLTVDTVGQLLKAAAGGGIALSGVKITDVIDPLNDQAGTSVGEIPTEAAIVTWVLQQIASIQQGTNPRGLFVINDGDEQITEATPLPAKGDYWTVVADTSGETPVVTGTFAGETVNVGDRIQFKVEVEDALMAAALVKGTHYDIIEFVGTELTDSISLDNSAIGASAKAARLLNLLKMSKIGVNPVTGAHGGIPAGEIPITKVDGDIESSGKEFVETIADTIPPHFPFTDVTSTTNSGDVVITHNGVTSTTLGSFSSFEVAGGVPVVATGIGSEPMGTWRCEYFSATETFILTPVDVEIVGPVSLAGIVSPVTLVPAAPGATHDEVPTALAVVKLIKSETSDLRDAIDGDIASKLETLESAVDDLEEALDDKLDLINGLEDEIVLIGSDKQVKTSGKKIVDEILASAETVSVATIAASAFGDPSYDVVTINGTPYDISNTTFSGLSDGVAHDLGDGYLLIKDGSDVHINSKLPGEDPFEVTVYQSALGSTTAITASTVIGDAGTLNNEIPTAKAVLTLLAESIGMIRWRTD